MLDGRAFPIGYPSNSNTCHILVPSCKIGISAVGEHKDGAWQFARSFLNGRQQQAAFWFPLHKETFNEVAEAALKRKSIWSSDYWGEITTADIELTENILSNAVNSQAGYDTLLDIVVDNSRPYFLGEKSAEQTAAEVQQRVTIYLNEQK